MKCYWEDLISYLIKELPVNKKRVVWLGQLASQKGEEPAHLGRSKVWVVHHHLGNQKDINKQRQEKNTENKNCNSS